MEHEQSRITKYWPAYLFSIGADTEINISEGPSTNTLGDAIFLLKGEEGIRMMEEQWLWNDQKQVTLDDLRLHSTESA